MEEKDFSGYLSTIIQHGCVMLGLGLAHDLGVLKLLCEAEQPVSLQYVTETLDLKERYTKELLSMMVAADIAHLDRATRLYTIPEGHRKPLMMSGGFCPILFTLGKRANTLTKCFKKDGPYGISFQESPEWFEWFNDYRSNMCYHTVNTEIIPLWSKQPGLVEKLELGIKVLDVGCGPGNYTNVLAQRFPNSTFIGLDYSKDAIEMANNIKKGKGVTNVSFVEGNALALPGEWLERFDMVFVYDALHDLPNPHKALAEIYRVLKKDGFFSVIEVGFHSDPADNAGNVSAAMYYTCSMFICLTSSMVEEPHIGYGACWGIEEIRKALKEQKFNIEGTGSMTMIGTKAFFYCTK